MSGIAASQPCTAGEPILDFAEYVAAKRPSLLRAARAITGNPDTAEDLLQTALVNVYMRWAGIRDRAAADAYVRRAMINQHNSWLRQKWRRQERPTGDLPEPSDRWSIPTRDPSRADPDLWALVKALPPRQRSAVVLRYYEDLTEAQTAAVLRCALGTVKWTTSRGLANLRRSAATTEYTGPVAVPEQRTAR
jgi:RNA polymerase sigma-70 factor (sigma-E family)